MPSKDYYSKRRTFESGLVGIDLPTLRSAFLTQYQTFETRGYFQEAFGQSCVEHYVIDGQIWLDTMLDVGSYVTVELGRGLWPISERVQEYSEDDLLDVIEFLFQYVSRPTDQGIDHRSLGCGRHHFEFDKAQGQHDYVMATNALLSRYRGGYHISSVGEIHNHHVGTAVSSDLFDKIFPAGLAVSVDKPQIATVDRELGRYLQFKESPRTGVLNGAVYPNFCMYEYALWADPAKRLQAYNLEVQRFGPQKNLRHVSWTILYNICDTICEKLFIQAFIEKFVVAYFYNVRDSKNIRLSLLKGKVPALIPQVWINWESLTKQQVRRSGIEIDGIPYRVDFAVFWNNKKYVIQIDGVEHYGVQRVDKGWDASESRYTSRIKEDRVLQTQGWQVFRVTNWEVKDQNLLDTALNQLRLFIGFDPPPAPSPVMTSEDIPY